VSGCDIFAVATEEELYAEISRAWYRMGSPGVHIACPMQPFAIGPELAYAVWSRPEDYAQRIVAVCARVVTFRGWQLPAAQQIEGVDGPPGEALDPAAAWWHPIEKPSGLGMHYWILGNGTIELRSLAPVDAPPPLEYGRRAAADQHQD
jgi:hypothetical protein